MIHSSLRYTIAGTAAIAAMMLAPLQAAIEPPDDNLTPPFMGFYGGAQSNNFGGQDRNEVSAKFLYRSDRAWLMDFQPFATWAEISGNSGYILAERWKKAHPNGQFVLGIAPLPGFNSNGVGFLASGVTWAKGANGEYNQYFVTLAQGLVNKGLGDSIIRIGYEFNAKFMPWHITHDNSQTSFDDRPDNFVAHWRNIVNAMRSVEGANFKFCWNGCLAYNLNGANTKTIIQQCYPGDPTLPPELDYVQYVGVDLYDSSYAANTYPYSNSVYPYGTDAAARQQRAWDDNIGNRDFGFNVWKAIAQAKGKPMALPEWGALHRTKDSHGGRDNPDFMQKMYNLIHETGNNIEWHIYFDYNSAGTLNSCITTQPSRPGEMVFPNAQLRYRKLFGLAPLPNSADIGTVGVPGTLSAVSLSGAGAGLAATTTDNFQYSSRPVEGPNDVFIVKISSMSIPSGQGGVMIRQSTAADAPYAALLVSGGDCSFQSRATTAGTAVVNAAVPGVTLPIWLKLVRRGSSITGYRSSNGLSWTYVGGQTVGFTGSGVRIGLTAASGNTSSLNVVDIDKVDDLDLVAAEVVANPIPNAVIVDNGPAEPGGFNNAFNSSIQQGLVNYLGATFLDAGPSSASYTWTPTLNAGLHDVYMRWPAGARLSHSTAVDIVSADGTIRTNIDETEEGFQWAYLGTYNFNAGQSGRVTIYRMTGDAFTRADATMFVPLPSPTLPAPKVSSDVGAPNLAGSAGFNNGIYTIQGAGTGLGTTSDQFQFVNQDLSGNQTMTIRITGLTNTDANAAAGVQMRATLDSNAPFVMLLTKPNGKIELRYRTTVGGTAQFASGGTLGAPSPAAPIWLRLMKNNTNFFGSYAQSVTLPTTWTTIGPTSVTLPSTYKAGSAVTSRVPATLATGVFDNVTP